MPASNVKPFPSRVKDLMGQQFGRLTVIGFLYISKYAHAIWKCKCVCGRETDVDGCSLRSGNTRSCGCFLRECSRKRPYKNGHKSGGVSSPEYMCWCNMKLRCSNKHNPMYKYYGGRGISVCERWRNSFKNFLADMGLKPSPELSIDRIDNDGNYEPGNCRWTTAKEQIRNRRKPRSSKG